MLEKLKEQVLEANLALVRQGLTLATWGNVSGLDRPTRRIVIKPSGIPCDRLKARDMVVVDLNGTIVEGSRRPSTDTPTHLVLYRAWKTIGGVVHTHSPYAVMFAQAGRAIPCLGTTHADYFHGKVPVTRDLRIREVSDDYETATGLAIVERFTRLDPMEQPAVLVARHGPFAWGPDPGTAVENAQVLELAAQMALGTLQLSSEIRDIPSYLLDKHYRRKHGPGAYYGQKTVKPAGGAK